MPNPLPKIEPLKGSIHIEWKRCGKLNCRCVGGNLHGPYYYRHVIVQGRQTKRYVRREKLSEAILAIETHRNEQAAMRQMRMSLQPSNKLTQFGETS